MVLGIALSITHQTHAAQRDPVSEVVTLREYAELSGSGIATGTPVYLTLPPFVGIVVNTGTAALGEIVPPTGNYMSGIVDLDALLRSGTVSGAIDVTMHGFPAGAYTVSAITESSSSTVVLGSLTVVSGSLPVTIVTGTVTTSSHITLPWISTGIAKFGKGARPFPAGFNPFDVASVAITDSNDDLVGAATLTPVPDGFLTALSPVQPGRLAPHAKGYALLHAATDTGFVVVPLTASTGMKTAATSVASEGAGGSATLSAGNTGGTTATLGTSGAGTVVLTGNNTYTGGTTIDGGTLTFNNGANLDTGDSGATITVNNYGSSGGVLSVGSGSFTLGSTPILSGSLVFIGGGVIGGGTLTILSPVTLSIGNPITDPLPVNIPTGHLEIHAHALPPHAWVTYALDGTDIGKALTNSIGDLTVFASQSASGKIPSSLDLFTVSTLTVHNAAGKVYLTAGF